MGFWFLGHTIVKTVVNSPLPLYLKWSPRPLARYCKICNFFGFTVTPCKKIFSTKPVPDPPQSSLISCDTALYFQNYGWLMFMFFYYYYYYIFLIYACKKSRNNKITTIHGNESYSIRALPTYYYLCIAILLLLYILFYVTGSQ